MTPLAIPASTAATPLLSLTAVSFDTEATALDVKSARILELGAVALINGAVSDAVKFSSLVRADTDVPQAATSIHGITRQMTEGAPGYADVYRAFRLFSGSHVLFGYAVAYDLSLLEAEHARAGIAWKPWVVFDVRSLVRFLNPPLPDHALEKVANWCGLAVEIRHRALADAVLTAEVLLALLPMLRERGVRTLGEAMAVCRRQEEQHSVSATSSELPASFAALARVDSFPYRHRVGSVMASPPLTIGPAKNLGEAIAIMADRKVSSLFVRPRSGSGDYGIITERDALRSLAADREKAFAAPVARSATFPLRSVNENDFLYVAMGLMRRSSIRHLGVVDSGGNLVGAVTQRDLLRLRADEALALTGALSDAAGLSELADIWRRLAESSRSLAAEDVDARDIAAIISAEVCALTKRAAVMAENEFAATRPAGLQHAVMVLGSGGRGESLLALDQDNAIVFECADVPAAQAWLASMASRMNAILDKIGVPYCGGGVMARNPAWCLSVSDWRERISSWLSRTAPADILNADIFFDGVAVHGAVVLADDLRNHAIAAASQSQAFLKLMSIAAADVPSSFTWLGRLNVDEQGRIDLKRHGIMPIFTAARVAALRYGIGERSTKSRLGALRGSLDIPAQALEALTEAHGLLLGIVLRQQLEDISAGVVPSNRIDPKLLSAREHERLCWALKQVRAVADIVGSPPV